MRNSLDITDYLRTGAENAKTARELAAQIDCNPRNISEWIEQERRKGQPICANCDAKHPGYYLAESADEIEAYCKHLHGRAGEIYKTRAALLETAKTLREAEA